MLSGIIENVLDRTVGSQESQVFRKRIVGAMRASARQDYMLPFIEAYVRAKLHIFQDKPKSSPNKIRILVLNENRYQADLDGLNKHPDVELVILPTRIHELINSIWYAELKQFDRSDLLAWIDKFTANKDPLIHATRERQVAFLSKLIPRLMKSARIDAISSCSCFYVQDRDWIRACKALSVPFFVLHKENMKDPIGHKKDIARYKKRGWLFEGTRVFMFSNLERTVMLGAGTTRDDQISIVGGLRTDKVFNYINSKKVKSPNKNQVVLFSFAHCIGGLWLKDAAFFSKDRSEGFVKCFDLVHATMVRLAADHPELKIIIKPKYHSEEWLEHIRAAALNLEGLNVDEIPNLVIDSQIAAQDAIEESQVVVGINSTTLLESKLFNRPVITPLFEEAQDKYFDTAIYYKKYLNEAFHVVDSPDALKQAIFDELAGEAPERPMPQGMIEDYLGFFDGQAYERVAAIMKQDIERLRQVREQSS